MDSSVVYQMFTELSVEDQRDFLSMINSQPEIPDNDFDDIRDLFTRHSNLSYAFDLLVSNHIWKIDETLSAEEELVNHMTSNVEQLELDEYEELMQSNSYLSSEDHNYPQARSKAQEDEETLMQMQQPDMLMDAPLGKYARSLKRRRRHAVESQRTA